MAETKRVIYYDQLDNNRPSSGDVIFVDNPNTGTHKMDLKSFVDMINNGFDSSIKSSGVSVSADNYSSIITNVNDQPVNSIYTYGAGLQSHVSNLPSNKAMTIINFAQKSTGGLGQVMLAIERNGSDDYLYFRTIGGSPAVWSSWVKMANNSDVEADTTLSINGKPADAKATGDAINDVKADLSEITGNEQIAYTVNNGYYPTSTIGNTVSEPTSSNNFQAAMISCAPGDQFTINAKSGSLGRAWAFLDSTKKVLRYETINGVITNKVVTAGIGEVYLVINNNKAENPGVISYIGKILVKRIDNLETESAKKEYVEELKTAFYNLQIDNLPIMLIKDAYVTNAGVITDYAGWDCSDYIPVKGYKSLKVKSSVQSGYNLFVNLNKEKVGNNFNVTTNYTTVNVPSNAEYVLMSNTAAGMENLEVSFIKYPVMDEKHPETEVTEFSQLIEMGVFNIEKAILSNMTDKPLDTDNAVATLINYSGAYASGNYTIQRLYQLSGKAWERLIYSPTGEVSLSWKRIDLDSDNHNFLKGKKLVTAGDSYTQAYWDGDYAEYNGKNYGYYIAQRNNMSFVNSGISGSTMAVTKTGSGHNPFVVDRYLNIPVDTDYLILWFGINDAANCNLGTIDDEVNNTFYGAWNIVLRYYLTNRPWMKILIVVTTGAIGWDGDTRLDFRQAIRNVAEKWGYPYLDWEKDKSISAFFDREGMSDEAKTLRRNAYGYNGPNNGHPNPQWYEYESTIIEAKLRAI